MEENKNLTPEEETVETETVKKEKPQKQSKAKPIKNSALFKRGSYSLVITVAVIVGVIIFNSIVGLLNSRFLLEYDMSSQKKYSMSEENIDYVKSVEDEIEIIFCADKVQYYTDYMAYYAEYYHSVMEDDTTADYYQQTVMLVEKYAEYNDNISVKFIDTQDTAFTEITAKYPSETINYGDIIVSCTKNGNIRYKMIRYTDIYNLTADTQYASYGYYIYYVDSNNIETALTSAIAYVVSSQTQKVAILTGHSSKDYTSEYQTLLKNNNYEIEVIDSKVVTSISSDFDAVVIPAPVSDFTGDEIEALSIFLDNGGALNKGLIFFADTSAPYLTNLYDYLSQWGIFVDEGVAFETNSGNYISGDPLTFGSYANAEDEIVSAVNFCLTSNNVPMTTLFETNGSMTASVLVATPGTTVAAPVGTTSSWTEADKYEKQTFGTVIQSAREEYDSDGKNIASYVMAFSSIDFIYSDYNEYSSVSNKNIVLAATERASGAQDVGIEFISKTITNESFADKVTDEASNFVNIIFMGVVPVACILVGIWIYIKRRNA